MDISNGAFVTTFLLTIACVNGLKCGQAVCKPDEYCCKGESYKNCCCYETPTGFGYHCETHNSISIGLPWYGVLIVVLVVVGLCIGITIGVILYRRRRRYTSMS